MCNGDVLQGPHNVMALSFSLLLLFHPFSLLLLLSLSLLNENDKSNNKRYLPHADLCFFGSGSEAAAAVAAVVGGAGVASGEALFLWLLTLP